jgi:tetratricopeptide (TPR) repeat protein
VDSDDVPPGGQRHVRSSKRKPAKSAGGANPARHHELSGTLFGSAILADHIEVGGSMYVGTDAPPPALVPSQLPSPPANFTGRSDELAELDQLLASGKTGSAKPIVLVGVGGVGKTWLAAQWANRVRGSFCEGQLHAELGCHQPGSSPDLGQVLGRFLTDLGTPAERVPATQSERSAMWRRLSSGRKLLVLLDDVESAEQVRALLPGPGPALVIVTTRLRLPGLAMDGAQFMRLGQLKETEAVELLGRVAGADRVSAEPEQARTVVRLCGCLPLAVAVCGAKLADHPRWPIGRTASELDDERDLRVALTIPGDKSVYAAFDASYRALDAETARMYRRAALIPGPDFGPDLAADATATDLRQAGHSLNVLVQSSLLEEADGNRFRFHDLVRMHAREQCGLEETGRERQELVARSVQWYLRQAVIADLAVIPARWRLGPAYDEPHELPDRPSPAAALAWLESELPGLSAAVRSAHEHGLHKETWQLCEALWGLFAYRKHFDLWISLHDLGVKSARACEDHRAEARMRVQLGLAYLELGQHEQAMDEFNLAWATDSYYHHPMGVATALEGLGLVSLARGNLNAAMSAFQQARAILLQAGCTRGVAMMTCHIGEVHLYEGRCADAIVQLSEARRLAAAVPDPYNEARALTGLGQSISGAGHHALAAEPLRKALSIMTDLGAPYEQARTRAALADAAAWAGDSTQASDQFSSALAIYDELGVPGSAQPRSPLRIRFVSTGLRATRPPRTPSGSIRAPELGRRAPADPYRVC